MATVKYLNIVPFIQAIDSVACGIPNCHIAIPLHLQGVRVLGTCASSIDKAENRFKFSRMLAEISVSQPKWSNFKDLKAAEKWCVEVGYPVLIRPSYVLSGAAMNVASNKEDLVAYIGAATALSEHPVVISKFIGKIQTIFPSLIYQIKVIMRYLL